MRGAHKIFTNIKPLHLNYINFGRFTCGRNHITVIFLGDRNPRNTRLNGCDFFVFFRASRTRRTSARSSPPTFADETKLDRLSRLLPSSSPSFVDVYNGHRQNAVSKFAAPRHHIFSNNINENTTTICVKYRCCKMMKSVLRWHNCSD